VKPSPSTIAARLDEIAAAIGPAASRDMSLAPLCTYRVGGRAGVLVTVESADELAGVSRAVGGSDLPVLVIGKGSNLLVADAGFDGVVVRLGDGLATIDVDRSTAEVVVGGAALLPVVARRTAAESLTGFEWAVGVPGSVGGAVRMNAGGHGSDMAASVAEVTVHDLRRGATESWPADRLRFGYRHSAITPDLVVVSARLQLAEGDQAASEAEIGQIVRWRRANQPGGQNAGSVFANPEGASAGRLIDAAGLKGFRVGTAEVSRKHANFIQADPGGSADDIYHLITLVRSRVAEAFGVELRCENLLIGFDDPARRYIAGGAAGATEEETDR
jgi:UDP-N-acetylmuramate dehydrogenase